MRALVVYESMSGSARELAEAIAAGLGASFDVRLAHADEVGSMDAEPADVLVAGGPAMASGPQEWFDGLGTVPPLFAAFDTRSDIPRLLTGAASVRIGRELRRRGATPVVPPESFLVTEHSGPKPGEEDRGRRWGEQVADAARHAQPVPSTGAAS
jgi:flavodoxin